MSLVAHVAWRAGRIDHMAKVVLTEVARQNRVGLRKGLKATTSGMNSAACTPGRLAVGVDRVEFANERYKSLDSI